MTAIDTRGLKRDSLFMMADVRLDGSTESVRAKVRNLSNSGMMIDNAMTAQCGQRLLVSLKQVGDIPGAIVWIQDGKIGIAFDHEIDANAARTKLYSGEGVPRYAKPVLSAPFADNFNRRRI